MKTLNNKDLNCTEKMKKKSNNKSGDAKYWSYFHIH